MVSILLKSCSHSLWVTFSVVKKNGALCPAGGNLWAPIKNFISAACYAVKVNFMMKVYRELNVFFNHQAQLFAKREHEGVVQMLEVSVCDTIMSARGSTKASKTTLCQTTLLYCQTA